MPKNGTTFRPIGKELSKIELRRVGHHSDKIGAEYLRRKSTHFPKNGFDDFPFGVPPTETATNFLKREVYRFARLYKKRDAIGLLEQEVRKIRKSNVVKAKSLENIFNLAFLCVFSEDDKSLVNGLRRDGRLMQTTIGVSAVDRELFANQLLYAHKHNVPADLLCGFLLQSGSPRLIRKKLKAGYREPARIFATEMRNRKRVSDKQAN